MKCTKSERSDLEILKFNEVVLGIDNIADLMKYVTLTPEHDPIWKKIIQQLPLGYDKTVGFVLMRNLHQTIHKNPSKVDDVAHECQYQGAGIVDILAFVRTHTHVLKDLFGDDHYFIYLVSAAIDDLGQLVYAVEISIDRGGHIDVAIIKAERHRFGDVHDFFVFTSQR